MPQDIEQNYCGSYTSSLTRLFQITLMALLATRNVLKAKLRCSAARMKAIKIAPTNIEKSMLFL